MPLTPDQASQAVNAQNVLTSASGGLVTMYILDYSGITDDAGNPGAILYFYPGTDASQQPIVFQGNSYIPLPVLEKDFQMSDQGTLPKPHLTFANLLGLFSGLCIQYQDLVGAIVTRKRTYSQWLDNSGGEGSGELRELPPDIFYIDRKLSENKAEVQFELATSLDLDGVMLPLRTVNSTVCFWQYRDSNCSFAQNLFVADNQDNTWSNLTQTFQGRWNPATSYVLGSVVFILPNSATGDAVPQYYIWTNAVTEALGQSMAPPSSGWVADQCSLSASVGCPLRFGGLLTTPGQPAQGTAFTVTTGTVSGVPASKGLPYGGFPGTQNIPNPQAYSATS